MPERLPIYEIEDAIVAGARADRRLIVSAPTGSGKSTQVPQMLLDHGLLGDGRALPGDAGYLLHAHRLALPHPLSGECLRLECRPPHALRTAGEH